MARPDLLEHKPSWGADRQGFVSITLGPMSTEQMLELVNGAVPGLPQQSAEAIVERAAGIPLYAVEPCGDCSHKASSPSKPATITSSAI